MNAPTAASKPSSEAPEAISSAAPGVDQATLIGMRRVAASQMPDRPIAIDSVIRPEVACVSLAPAARRPARTMAKELAKPTIATSRPIATADGEMSARRGRGDSSGGATRSGRSAEAAGTVSVSVRRKVDDNA